MRNIKRYLGILIAGAALAVFGQSDKENNRFAIIIDVNGKAYYSSAGVEKGVLRKGLSLPENSKIWTEKGDATVYFRRIATILKMEPKSELDLQKLDMHLKDGLMVKETELGLNKGRMLVRARVLLPDSRFTVHTPVSTFSVPDIGYARYDLRADGTAIVGKKSKLPLRAEIPKKSTNQVVAGTMVSKEGKTNAVPGDGIIAELDELEELADALAAPLGNADYIPGKSPVKKE